MPLLDNNYNAVVTHVEEWPWLKPVTQLKFGSSWAFFFLLITLQYKEQQQWGEFKVNKIKLKTQTKSEKLIIKMIIIISSFYWTSWQIKKNKKQQKINLDWSFNLHYICNISSLQFIA